MQSTRSNSLRPLGVNFPLCLAPMVGLSHYPLRQLVREYLPQGAETIWPSEMLSSRRIPSESEERLRVQLGPMNEPKLVPQLLANDEDCIRMSLERLAGWELEGIDINMGCPVQKALKHNYGVALMGDRKYAKEVVRVTVRHSRVPVSVKIRAGENGDLGFLNDFCSDLVEAGASWLCLHPRTAAQKRRGRADWDQISYLVEAMPVPIIGNGDVQTVDDAFAMLDQTQCSMVMVGRALTARPWLLWQYGERAGWPAPASREGDVAPRDGYEEAREYHKCACRLLELFRMHFEEKTGIKKYLFYIKVSGVWLEFGHDLFKQMSKCKTYDMAEEVLNSFFSRGSHKMSRRTELRY